MLELLTHIAAIFSGPRYRPEIEWASDNWTHNVFRVFELLFGRKFGIRIESSLVRDKDKTIYQFHTLEASIAHLEGVVRGAFKGLKVVRVHVPVLAFAGGPGMLIPRNSPYLFAIAYDASSKADVVIGTTSVTATHTASGSDRLVVALSWCGTSAAITVTYDSVDMSTVVTTTTRADNGIYNRVFVLVAPSTTSSASVAFSIGASGNLGGMLSTFTGCNQSGQPDGSNGVLTQADGTSASSNITVTASDCWVVGSYLNDNSPANSVTGTGALVTRRIGTWGAAFGTAGWFDSAGTVSTGSIAYGGSYGVSGGQTLCAVSIKPVSASGPTNLKSYDGNLKANIKSIAGNLIANVKSLSGNS